MIEALGFIVGVSMLMSGSYFLIQRQVKARKRGARSSWWQVILLNASAISILCIVFYMIIIVRMNMIPNPLNQDDAPAVAIMSLFFASVALAGASVLSVIVFLQSKTIKELQKFKPPEKNQPISDEEDVPEDILRKRREYHQRHRGAYSHRRDHNRHRE